MEKTSDENYPDLDGQVTSQKERCEWRIEMGCAWKEIVEL